MTVRDGERPKQGNLSLVDQIQELEEGEARRFLKTIAEVVENAGVKEVADALGHDPSYVSHVMAGRRPLPLAWLFAIAQRFDPDLRIARHFNRALNCTAPRKLQPATEAQFAAAARRVLKRHGLRDLQAEIVDELESGETE